MADYRGDGGRIGARAADTLLLHRADERRLRIAAGRLGEALLLLELFAVCALALGEVGYALDGRDALVVLIVVIHGGIAGEDELGISGAEHMAGAGGIDGYVIIHRVGHLAGGEAAPDEAVELILLARQVLAHHLRCQGRVGGPDGLVRVLGPGPGLIAARLRRAVRLAVVRGYIAARGAQGLLAQAQRVGTHVGDEADGALPGDVHALVELLGNAHSAPRRHAQAAAGLLLQGTGYKRGRRAALLLAALDRVYGESVVLHVGNDSVNLRLVFELGLFLALAVIAGGELAPVGTQQRGVQQPVLLRHKGAYLALTVHHHARGHALDAAGREAAADLFPQQRAQLIADDAVEYAPRLLRVHQVNVDVARGLYALCYDLLGDLVEGDAAGLVVRELEKLLQVPRYSLALAVRVGCQIDHAGGFGPLFQLGYYVFLALYRYIFGRKPVFYIHAHSALGQVPQMAHAGHDFKVLAQVFLYGPRLRRRLDYHERRLSFRH